MQSSPCGEDVFEAPAERTGRSAGREEASAIAGGERLKRAKTMGSMGGGAGDGATADGATGGRRGARRKRAAQRRRSRSEVGASTSVEAGTR